MSEYRDALRALASGDTIHSGVPDPWNTRTDNVREETVTHAGRYLIHTTGGVYCARTGRCFTLDQPLAYPRRILTTPQKDTP